MSIGGSIFGDSVFGSVGSTPSMPAVGSIPLLQISGTDYSGKLQPDSFRFTNSINQRGRATFTLVDTSQTIHFSIGEPVQITQSGTTLIFAGLIDEVDEKAPISGGVTFVTVTCSDYMQLADRFFVADKYEDMLAGVIVRDILNSATPLADEGVTEGYIADGVKVSVPFRYKQASKALTEIADMVGFVWYIDHQKRLYFFERSLYSAPYNFGGSYDLHYRNTRYKKSRAQYRNRQYLRAGKGRIGTTADPVEQDFRGDGETDTFTVKYEVAEQPVIRIDEDGDGVFETLVASDRIGIRSVDDEDEELSPGVYKYLWFYAVEEKDISQNGNLSRVVFGSKDYPDGPLSSSQGIQVQYVGLFPIIERQDNVGEQKRLAAIEGGTGIIEAIEDDESIDGTSFAEERAKALLAKGDQMSEEFTLETDLTGFKAGQVINLDFTEHSISGQWLIENLTTRYVANKIFRTQLRCILHERQDSEFDFWRRMADAGRRFVVRENEKLLILLKNVEEFQNTTEYFAVGESDTRSSRSLDEAVMFMGSGLMYGGLMGGSWLD